MKKILPALALLLVGCQDLDVTNPNEPDRDRATRQPAATETFVASAFRPWWRRAGHDDYPSWAFSTMANEITSGFADFGQLELSAEPRSSWNNSPVNARNQVSEGPWYDLYAAISSATDGAAAIENGLVITDATTTARTHAFAKFMQGISHGYLGLYFDSAFVVDESLQLDTITEPQLRPYPEVITEAIAMLDSAISIAQGNSFTFPDDNFMFVSMNSTQFIQLANSFAARLMVYSARTPAERALVNWTEVIARIDAGITTDFAPIAQPDILWDDWKRLVARVRQTARPSDFGRPSYWLIGPADSTNGFVNWVATPVADRVAFQLRTRDRRIQGTTGPASAGTYVGYNQNNIFTASRGTYRFSWYFFRRYGLGETWQNGPQPAMLVSEMNLLKAEGLMRLGQADQAVPLINLTRQTNGQLPAVTVDGPPDEVGCVPRKMNGACGSLWDALRYEKRIEGLGVSGVIAFFDARGWQMLPEHTVLHLPVPGAELGVLQRDLYTYGGPGGSFAAAAPNPEACPAGYTSARCP
ncbi:MAG TPA: hypothetical protein VEB19_15570 [Gemmatimonadaceae bacterium]|nr:hypothetical protein [Gemmatimonadaceae bacterium]